MGTLSRNFPIYLVATAFLVVSADESFAAGVCDVKTARQSGASSQVLCECDAVTSRMIRYVQRRADFDKIVARLGAECAPLAALLTDFPTASTGTSNQRSGDGHPDENRDTGTPGGESSGGGVEATGPSGGPETTGVGTPGGEQPGGEQPGGEQPGGEQPGGEQPGGEQPGGEQPGGEQPGGEEPGGEEPGGEEPGGEEPGGEEEPT